VPAFPDCALINLTDLAEDIEAEIFRFHGRVTDDKYKVEQHQDWVVFNGYNVMFKTEQVSKHCIQSWRHAEQNLH
jgi:hypothetical protein